MVWGLYSGEGTSKIPRGVYSECGTAMMVWGVYSGDGTAMISWSDHSEYGAAIMITGVWDSHDGLLCLQ